jgi:hypothetical protein
MGRLAGSVARVVAAPQLGATLVRTRTTTVVPVPDRTRPHPQRAFFFPTLCHASSRLPRLIVFTVAFKLDHVPAPDIATPNPRSVEALLLPKEKRRRRSHKKTEQVLW